jgi:Arc/MetJ-type ribon-helix-helix transcriptional regulator
VFPGGALIGCDAGFLNAPRIKGSHAAIKTGMLAAEAAFDALAAGRSRDELAAYPTAFEASWLHDELHRARNFKPYLDKGLVTGALLFGIDQIVFRGKAPWTLHRSLKADHQKLKPAAECTPIDYPKPDNRITFDKLSSVFLSNTNHEENQPAHLTLKDAGVPVATNLARYAGPESALLPGRCLRVRARSTAAEAADQLPELRALQDLRHQGPDAEHRLGRARGRRRAELREHVGAPRRRGCRRLPAAHAIARQGERALTQTEACIRFDYSWNWRPDMRETITISVPEEIKAEIDRIVQEEGISRSDVVRESLRDYLFVRSFRRLRSRLMAKALARGVVTDEDVFDRVS